MHQAVREFVAKMALKFPQFFHDVKVLEVGSLDINGSTKEYFENCDYVGLDIAPGKNVDVVVLAHKYAAPDDYFDVVISTEMLEHDVYCPRSLANMVRLLRSGGLMLITCAGPGRVEHGTLKRHPASSPLTTKIAEWCNYYRNLTAAELSRFLGAKNNFSQYQCQQCPTKKNDTQFWGIKK